MKGIFNRAARRRASSLLAPLLLSFSLAAPVAHAHIVQPNASTSGSGYFTARGYALNAREAALVRAFFGPLRTDLIRKHYEPRVPAGESPILAARTRLYEVGFYGRKNQAADYTRTHREAFGVFMHEMTHVWQYEKTGTAAMRQSLARCPRPDVYAYNLHAASRFSDYCVEQQGRMVQNYALRFIVPDHVRPLSRDDMLLRHVIESHFPGARALREMHEKRNRPDSRGPRG